MRLFVVLAMTIFGISARAEMPMTVESRASALIDWEHTTTVAALSAGRARRMNFLWSLHSRGHENKGIYTYDAPDGSARLLKLVDGDNARGFLAEIEGMLLAAMLGGPKVYRAGRLASGVAYIEMERVFADRKKTFTLKGLAFTYVPRRFLPVVTPAQIVRIAKILRQALELGIKLVDPDFIFVADGDVRMIDGARFSPAMRSDVLPRSGEAARDSDFYYEFVVAIEALYRLDESYGTLALSTLKDEITRSTAWTSDEKWLIRKTIDFHIRDKYGRDAARVVPNCDLALSAVEPAR